MAKKIYHPAFPDVVQEVEDDQKGEWKDAGWRLTPVPEDKAAELTAPVEGDE